jgi:hypothetical protein
MENLYIQCPIYSPCPEQSQRQSLGGLPLAWGKMPPGTHHLGVWSILDTPDHMIGWASSDGMLITILPHAEPPWYGPACLVAWGGGSSRKALPSPIVVV